MNKIKRNAEAYNKLLGITYYHRITDDIKNHINYNY